MKCAYYTLNWAAYDIPRYAIACCKVCSAFHAVLQTRISQNNLVRGKVILSIQTLRNVHARGHYIRAMCRYICYLPDRRSG